MLNSKNSDHCGRNYTEIAEFVIEHIKTFGFTPNSESRFMKMHRVMTDGTGLIQPDDPRFEIAREAIRDFKVLEFVFEQADAHSTDVKFQHLMKIALKDSVLPQKDRDQSKGRDAQFELFVAAICQNAGMLPISREEPDVTCHVGDIKFAIAAKRVKNIDRLKERVCKAADQIKKARLPGIIVLETSIARNRNNQSFTMAISDEEFGLLYSETTKRFIDDFHDKIQGWIYGKGVRGFMIHDQQIRFHSNSGWSLEGMTMSENLVQWNSRRNREFDIFDKKYKTGLPNVTHS